MIPYHHISSHISWGNLWFPVEVFPSTIPSKISSKLGYSHNNMCYIYIYIAIFILYHPILYIYILLYTHIYIYINNSYSHTLLCVYIYTPYVCIVIAYLSHVIHLFFPISICPIWIRNHGLSLLEVVLRWRAPEGYFWWEIPEKNGGFHGISWDS